MWVVNRGSGLAPVLLLLAASGCDPAGMGGACASDEECGAGRICVDGACRAGPDGGNRDAGGSGMIDAGPRADAGGPPDGGTDAGGDASCGGENVTFDYRPPNVLVIFDRSCSMRRRLDDTSQFGTGPDDGRTRWAVARDAVVDLTTRFETRVFWGLMAYPDPREGCGMPVEAEVPPGPGTAAMIDSELRRNRIQPFGLCGLDNSDTTTQPRQTPTADALTSAMGLPALSDPLRDSFVIVVTDGGVTCGVSDAELSSLAASLAAASVPVAVIGFQTGSDEGSLDALASSGGLPNPGGPPSYFVAESRADLDRVFDEIAARVVSCDLSLTASPPDESMIFVNVNDAPLAMDAANGWTYASTGNLLTLNGDSCTQLRRGEITRISVSFGCPPAECEPQPEICNGFDDDCDDRVDEACLL